MEQLFSPLLRATLLVGLAFLLWSAPVAASGRFEEAREEFHARTAQQAVWSAPGRLSALLSALEDLREDGLDPADYGFSVRRSDSTACIESIATAAYLRALDDLAHGRLQQADVEPLWRADGTAAGISATRLAQHAADGLDDIPAAFAALRPALPVYDALRQHLAALHAESGTPEPTRLPDGITLRTGARHPAVELLRARLERHGYRSELPDGGDFFDIGLTDALLRFQRDHGLQPDGVLGRATRGMLNLDLAQRIGRTRANLERWRWLTAELRPTQVRVDVAGAELRYLRDGELRWAARVQVGRNERATPLLHSRISYVTLNPPWVVPPTILREDKLPAIRANPQVLEQNRLRVFDRHGAELDPAGIDWSAPGPITLRQDPGPENALGQVVLRFANPFAIYLHDTPSQMQFASWRRTFSSGCVRVERAFELAELLLADASDISAETVATELGSGRTRNLHLRTPVPILIAYWTAEVGADGALRWRPDSYGHDAAIAAALDHAPPHPLPQCAR